MTAMPPWADERAIETSTAALLLSGVAAEIAATTPRGQQAAFYRAVGARIAAIHPVGVVDDLAALTGAVNRVWMEYGSGEARFEMAADGIVIIHNDAVRGLAPLLGNATEGLMRPVLEGVYDAWLRPLGSSADVTTWTLWWSEGEVRLKHGLRRG
ncbi:cellulose biosynthesis protein BcsD [Sphingomonas silueang]|uniref:cellulose biosynthesis protein BcsD n=1 Tax=Sphingomonas silueang TaxID=3156617 RepID=UPI0032B3ADC0